MNPLLDTDAIWNHHVANVLSDEKPGRNPRALSGSDLHGCEFDLHERLRGAKRVPRTLATFSAFERGHAYEKRVYDALLEASEAHGYGIDAYDPFQVIEHGGIPGHPDFLLKLSDGTPIVLDVTTTASKFTEWKYGHALKSAFYAQALGYDIFVEWVFSIGFGGNIFAQQAHWFGMDDVAVRPDGSPMRDAVPQFTWRERVEAAISRKKRLIGLAPGQAPLPEPPFDPIDGEPEIWRCKSYCDAVCPKNQKLKPMQAVS